MKAIPRGQARREIAEICLDRFSSGDARGRSGQDEPYSGLVRYGFIAQFVGGVMLITSKDVQVLYITGWIIGSVYLCLWLVLFFSKNAWNSTK